MKDRVPLYPGRVTLTPVPGQPNKYDMVRADEPTQAGTPLNKATLLPDAVAALYGLGPEAVPGEVFAAIKPALDAKAKIATGSYVGTGTYGSENKNSINIGFAPKLFVVVGPGPSESTQCMVAIGANTRAVAFRTSSPSVSPGTTFGSTNTVTVGSTMTWHNSQSARYQLNDSGLTYNYAALG